MIFVGILLGILVFGAIFIFNRMIALRRLTENAWSDVDVFLRKRADLIPNLVEAVRGAAAYEQRALEGITAARSRALVAPNLMARQAVENEISRDVTRLVVRAEKYPELQASDHFLALQEALTTAERHIADSRRYYNACVRDFNTMIESFPQSLIARTAGFRPKEFFELESIGERSAPAVRGL
jgi:LemA protein